MARLFLGRKKNRPLSKKVDDSDPPPSPHCGRYPALSRTGKNGRPSPRPSAPPPPGDDAGGGAGLREGSNTRRRPNARSIPKSATNINAAGRAALPSSSSSAATEERSFSVRDADAPSSNENADNLGKLPFWRLF
jgi:hypothetical protein